MGMIQTVYHFITKGREESAYAFQDLAARAGASGKAVEQVFKGLADTTKKIHPSFSQLGTSVGVGIKGVMPKLREMWTDLKNEAADSQKRLLGTGVAVRELSVVAKASGDAGIRGLTGNIRSLEDEIGRLKKKGLTKSDLIKDADIKTSLDTILTRLTSVQDPKALGKVMESLVHTLPIGELEEALGGQLDIILAKVHPETRLMIQAQLEEQSLRKAQTDFYAELKKEKFIVTPELAVKQESLRIRSEALQTMKPTITPTTAGAIPGAEAPESKKSLGLLGKIATSLKAGFGPILTSIGPFRLLAEAIAPVAETLRAELMPLLFPIQELLLGLVQVARPLIYAILIPMQQALMLILSPIIKTITFLTELTQKSTLAKTVFLGLAFAIGAVAIAMNWAAIKAKAHAIAQTVVTGYMLVSAAAHWIAAGGITAAATATWAFTVALLANPITWIVLAIVGAVAAVAGLAYGIYKLVSGLGDFWDVLLILIGPIGWIIEAFRLIYHLCVGGSPGLIPAFEVLGSVVGSVFSFIGSIVKTIGGVFEWLWNLVGPIISAISTGIGAIGTALGAVAGVVAAPFKAIGSGLSSAWHWIVGGSPGLIPALGQLGDVSADTMGGIRNSTDDLSESLAGAVSDVGDQTGKMGQDTAAEMEKLKASVMRNPITDLLGAGFGAVGRGFSSMFSSIFGGGETEKKKSATEGPWGGGFGVRIPLKVQIVGGGSNAEVVHSLSEVEGAIKEKGDGMIYMLREIYAALTEGGNESPTLARLGAME